MSFKNSLLELAAIFHSWVMALPDEVEPSLEPAPEPAPEPEPEPELDLYEIGEGKLFENIGDVPWSNIKAGDEILIHWRPEPYRECFAISARGTEELPILIKGVPGPNGELPVISGENAVWDAQFATFPQMSFLSNNLILVHSAVNSPSPGYITIDGLELVNATPDLGGILGNNTRTLWDGTVSVWGRATGIYLSKFDNVTVRNCKIHDCNTGIFTSDVRPCNDLLIEGNHIYDNGKLGSWHSHSVYIQCVRPVYRNNVLGPIIPGSSGGVLKDRSTDVLIEGNVILEGARQIDLSGWQGEIADRAAAPNANRAIIRNNSIRHTSGGHIGYVESNRNTPVEISFTNNTIYMRRDQSAAYYRMLWRTEYVATTPIITIDKCLFDIAEETEGQVPTAFRVAGAYGTLNLGDNWTRRDWAGLSSIHPALVIIGEFPISTGLKPQYTDIEQNDFSLAVGSSGEGYGIE